ncbi:MAG: hypothetical protein ACFB00_10360 [Parvularculaceae bacterium]
MTDFIRIRDIAFSVVALVLAVAPRTAMARDNLVTFVGVGYLSEETQPQLVDLLFSRDATYAAEGDALLASVERIASATLTDRAVGRWSRYGLVANAAALDAALAKKLRRPATGPDRDALFETFSSVYGVILIGGLEAASQARTTYRGDDGSSFYNHWALTSVTAALVDLKAGGLTLSATGLGVSDIPGDRRANLSPADRSGMFRRAYEAAAAEAVEGLAGLMRRSGPGRADRAKNDPVHAVTDVWVQDDKSVVHDLFGRRKLKQPTRPTCAPTRACVGEGGPCRKLAAILAHGMTAAMTRAGYRTEPPLQWSGWRAGASRNATIRLVISELENAPEPLDRLFEDVAPERADVKVVPILWAAHEKPPHVEGNVLEVRIWAVDLNYRTFRTAEGDCGQITYASPVLPAATNPTDYAAARGDHVMDGPVGRPPNELELDQLMVLLAIIDGFEDEMVTALRKRK